MALLIAPGVAKSLCMLKEWLQYHDSALGGNTQDGSPAGLSFAPALEGDAGLSGGVRRWGRAFAPSAGDFLAWLQHK